MVDKYFSNKQYGLIKCKKIIHDTSRPIRIRKDYYMRQVAVVTGVKSSVFISDLLKMDPQRFVKYTITEIFSYDRSSLIKMEDVPEIKRPPRYYLKPHQTIKEDEFNKLKLRAKQVINRNGLTFIYTGDHVAPRFIIRECM